MAASAQPNQSVEWKGTLLGSQVVLLLRYKNDEAGEGARAPILPLGNQWKKMVCTGGGWPAPIILSGLVGSGPMSHPKWASPLPLQVALDCRQKHKSFGLISLFPSSALR